MKLEIFLQVNQKILLIIESIRELAKLAGFKIIEENGPKEEDRFKIETIF